MLESLSSLVAAVLALDQTLARLAAEYGAWLYALLFAVVFAETGLVVTPFLPGDSLLFVAGAVAAGVDSLDVHVVVVVLIAAAILGDSVNYAIGRWIGPKVFEHESRWIKREYLTQTQSFYDRYGAVTIVIGRFVPIVRTFAPFLAGVAEMRYRVEGGGTLGLSVGPADGRLDLELALPEVDARLVCGHGTWLEGGRTSTDGLRTGTDRAPSPLAGAYAWRLDDRLEVRAWASDTAFGWDVDLRFEGDRVDLELRQNVAFTTPPVVRATGAADHED